MEKAISEQSQILENKGVIVESDQIAKTKAQMKEFFHQLDSSFFSKTRDPAAKLKSHLVINDDIPRISGMDNIEWCEFCETMAAELINDKATETTPTAQSRVESMSYADYQQMMYDNDHSISQGEMNQAYRAHMRQYYKQDGRDVPEKWL